MLMVDVHNIFCQINIFTQLSIDMEVCLPEIDIEHDDIRARAEFAKLERDNCLQPVQLLKFDDSASDQECLLLQLEDGIVGKLEAGQSFVIRGNTDDSAVFCSDDATYDLKKAMSSNTMICLDSCETNIENMYPYGVKSKEPTETVSRKALAWNFTYMELKQVFPRVSRLLNMLKQCMYKGPASEKDIDLSKVYTFSELVDVIQCSEDEAMQHLLKINACCIGGRWRLFDFGYSVECMGEIFQVIDSESWNCAKIPVKELCQVINDSGELVPSFVVEHLLHSFGLQYEGEDGLKYSKLDERKIARFFVEMLLRDVERFNLSEFLEVWRESLPSGMSTDSKYLMGLALTDSASQPPSIKLLKSEDLPIDIDKRFEALFQAKEKWTFEEISPYLEDVCLESKSVTSVLTKHARTSTSRDGAKIFSSRNLRS